MRSWLVFLFVVVVGAACGGGNAVEPPARPARLPDAGPPPVATVTPQAQRIASSALLEAWPIAEPEMLLYVDFERALRPELVLAQLVPVLATLTSQATPAAQMICIRDAVLATKELLAGAYRGSLVIARFDRAHVPPVRACFGASVSAVSVRGADDAWAIDRDVVATSRDLLLIGNKALVESAIERQGAGAGALRPFGLAPDDLARFHVTSGATIDARLSESATHLGTTIELEARSAHEAEQIAQTMKGLPSQIPPTPTPSEHDLLVHLASALHATQLGKHVSITFSLDEPVVDQARDLGVLVVFAKRGIDDYLIAVKQAEARNNVGAIARDFTVWWEREELTQSGVRKKKKLMSLPAVPSTVPRGVKVQTKPDDWKAWAPIQFSLDVPQYYQYEVRASKDGTSVSITARGDLNGDGKTSLFELVGKLSADGGLIFAPNLTETNPAE